MNALLARANVSGLANNPSPTLDDITAAYSQHHAVLVVCPARADSPALVEAARALYASLLASLTWAGDHEAALVFFESQAALEANVSSRAYGSEAQPVKIGAAVVLNDVAGVGVGGASGRPRWDYSVRVNFTQNFEAQMDAVGCVHANCGFTYSIPPTKFITNPFVRPARADFMFGYTYSGFATLQKAVDDFILNNASTQGPISTTVRAYVRTHTRFHPSCLSRVVRACLRTYPWPDASMHSHPPTNQTDLAGPLPGAGLPLGRLPHRHRRLPGALLRPGLPLPGLPLHPRRGPREGGQDQGGACGEWIVRVGLVLEKRAKIKEVRAWSGGVGSASWSVCRIVPVGSFPTDAPTYSPPPPAPALEQTMKIMGLSSLAANLSWVATMLAQSALTVLLMTLLGARSVFFYSNGVLVFLFLLAFSLALITFVFLLSTCFNKAKTAATAGTVLFFGTFFPYYALTGAGTGTATKAAACLLAPTCLGLGSDVIAAFEGGLMGLHWDNLWVQPGETNFSYSLAVGMLLLDAALYALLAAYLEAVLPSEYGTQLPWYFPLTPDWWRQTFGKGRGGRHARGNGSSSSSSSSSSGNGPLLDLGEEAAAVRSSSPAPTAALLPPSEPGHAQAQDDGEVEGEGEGQPTVEPVEPELRRQVEEGRSLSLRGLRKVYETTSGPRVAVAGLSLDLYEGQCSVLLGHNGAGKSTTIAMLTGLVPPTAGEAWVRGKRLTQEMGGIRQDMGLCPQHDTLWDDLTVTEHLELFGTLKGVAAARLKEEVARWIEEVGLGEKAHVEAGRLSGGMKRKLCLAMALIGGCVAWDLRSCII